MNAGTGAYISSMSRAGVRMPGPEKGQHCGDCMCGGGREECARNVDEREGSGSAVHGSFMRHTHHFDKALRPWRLVIARVAAQAADAAALRHRGCRGAWRAAEVNAAAFLQRIAHGFALLQCGCVAVKQLVAPSRGRGEALAKGIRDCVLGCVLRAVDC